MRDAAPTDFLDEMRASLSRRFTSMVLTEKDGNDEDTDALKASTSVFAAVSQFYQGFLDHCKCADSLQLFGHLLDAFCSPSSSSSSTEPGILDSLVIVVDLRRFFSTVGSSSTSSSSLSSSFEEMAMALLCSSATMISLRTPRNNKESSVKKDEEPSVNSDKESTTSELTKEEAMAMCRRSSQQRQSQPNAEGKENSAIDGSTTTLSAKPGNTLVSAAGVTPGKTSTISTPIDSPRLTLTPRLKLTPEATRNNRETPRQASRQGTPRTM